MCSGRLVAALAALVAVAACRPEQAPSDTAKPPALDVGSVDQARITAADSEPQNWLSHGRTYSEQRFSPLASISRDNAHTLGLAWSFDTSMPRGAEATPIVVDGVMYLTSAWSAVFALDAKTGALIWSYDPAVEHSTGARACCDVINRGVAVWKGRIYVGTVDGRLVALDAKTGEPVWNVLTVDPAQPYTISGAPRIAKGLVFIGNSGAEFGVRGYVGAYDAETGALKWRFYTVPGDPAKGPDNAASDSAMAQAARTWTGNPDGFGRGGTVWDAITYDPDLDQLYIGVANGTPWNRSDRSPGGGDNLFLASIVALDATTGQYRWHYQETPGEMWDYDATQQIVLADLPIDGTPRKVLMQAPKNGFFYVIDRVTGKVISAKPIVAMAKDDGKPGKPVAWAYDVDLATGRPIENPRASYADGPTLVQPSGFGAHNWQPVAFSPQTGLMYIPVQDMPGYYAPDKHYKFRPFRQNMGTVYPPILDPAFGAAPFPAGAIPSYLLAWDPVAQKEAWRADHRGPWNGGALATAGDLVFEGTVDGKFEAYDARTGKTLWSYDNHYATMAGPITYAVDGEQYVAVMSGYGGVFFLVAGPMAPKPGAPVKSRVSVFKLGGTAQLPTDTYTPAPAPKPPVTHAAMAEIKQGGEIFSQFCSVCHGPGAVGDGVLPDLRRSLMIQDAAIFRSVVSGGLADAGMPNFTGDLSPAEQNALRAYIAFRAQPLHQAEPARTVKPATPGAAAAPPVP